MKKQIDIRSLTLIAMLIALVVVLTPMSLSIGDLAITFNVIPVAIGAIALGPIGGAVVGAAFGICSFLQCFAGILGVSHMGEFTFAISPFLTFVQRFFPRVLDGFCVGLIFRAIAKLVHPKVSCFVTGFCTALLNTIFFMTALVLTFGNNAEFNEKYMQNKAAVVYVVSSIGTNAILEMVFSTLIAGAVGFALIQAKLIKVPTKKSAQKA